MGRNKESGGTYLAFKVVVAREEQATRDGEGDRRDAAKNLLVL